jgi:peptidoglycan/LPS O-acetylase OafA/YrhL
VTAPTDQGVNGRIANLEGLRAISVALVFAFHAQILGLRGGFVGVSVFFTLSGYLLTRRLLRRPLTRRAITAYWAGRWRRILPAALTILIAVTAYEWWAGETPAGAPRRLWMTAVGLGNWRQIADHRSYAKLFDQPDRLIHYWSLGIEEQVYLLLPVVLVVVMLLPRWRWRLTAVVTLAAGSFAAPLVTGWSVARVYYGTDTRVGEILCGVALGLVHHVRHPSARTNRRAVAGAGCVALAGILAVALTVQASSEFIRSGLFPLMSVLSVTAIHAAATAPGMLGGLLETAPFRVIGGLSYPIYLVHWPLLVILRSRDLPPLSVTMAAASASILLGAFVLAAIEQPIRRRSTPAVGGLCLALAAVTIAVAVIAMPQNRPAEFLQALEAEQSATIIQRGAPAPKRSRVAKTAIEHEPITTSATDRQTPLTTARAPSTAPSPSPSGLLPSAPGSAATFEPPTAAPPAEATDTTATATTSAAATATANSLGPPPGDSSSPADAPTPAAPMTSPAPASPASTEMPRVALFGDSGALSLALVVAHQVTPAELNYVGTATMLGCGLANELEPARCSTVPQRWNDLLSTTPVDVAVVMSCQWDVLERDIPGVGVQAVGQPQIDAIIRQAYRRAIRQLIDHHVHTVAWVICPPFSQHVGFPPQAVLQRSRDPRRIAALDTIVRSLQPEFSGSLTFVDLAGWMASRTDDAALRPDGSHFAYAQRTDLADALPLLIDAAIGQAVPGT